jgi:lysozyme
MKFNPKMTLAALGITSLGALIPTFQIPYTAPKEGLSLSVYLDSVGVPTICYGKTSGVRPGMTMTKAECEHYLVVELKSHCEPLWKVTDPEKTPVGLFIATCDWIYQYGEPKWNSSTLKKKYVAKDFQGVCGEFPRWKYAGKVDCSNRLSNCYGVWTRGLDREALCNASV